VKEASGGALSISVEDLAGVAGIESGQARMILEKLANVRILGLTPDDKVAITERGPGGAAAAVPGDARDLRGDALIAGRRSSTSGAGPGAAAGNGEKCAAYETKRPAAHRKNGICRRTGRGRGS